MMDVSIRLVVHKGNTIFDDVIVSYSAFKYRKQSKAEQNISQSTINNNICDANHCIRTVRLNKKGYNAYLISAYITTLRTSNIYRKSAIRLLLEFINVVSQEIAVDAILVRLHTPRKQFLDYKWNEKIMHMVLEKREADHAMSWLSTLGGAFSALGEEFEHCAKMAGKISVRQFELALRLGNPLLVARCKLYAALSLIQQGYFKTPKRIIKNIYKFALHEDDVRLQNMCLGVWAKLKYSYILSRQRKLCCN